MSSVSRVGEALHAALAADTVAHRPNHAGAGRLSFAVARGADRFWARVAADDGRGSRAALDAYRTAYP